MDAGSGGRLLARACCSRVGRVGTSKREHAVERKYVTAPPAPASQSDEAVQAKSAGCLTCHTQTDATTHAPESRP